MGFFGRAMVVIARLCATFFWLASFAFASLSPPELSGSIKSVNRNPRLFYVSTTTSTSFATTRCFVATGSGSCRRKKRELVSDELERNSNNDLTKSSELKKLTESHSESEIEKESPVREAKMLLYWVTTTSTTTSYTATSTLATLECIPNGFSLTSCQG